MGALAGLYGYAFGDAISSGNSSSFKQGTSIHHIPILGSPFLSNLPQIFLPFSSFLYPSLPPRIPTVFSLDPFHFMSLVVPVLFAFHNRLAGRVIITKSSHLERLMGMRAM